MFEKISKLARAATQTVLLDRWLPMTALLRTMALALSGRSFPLGMKGAAQDLIAPMAIEMDLLEMFCAGRRWLAAPKKSDRAQGEQIRCLQRVNTLQVSQYSGIGHAIRVDGVTTPTERTCHDA